MSRYRRLGCLGTEGGSIAAPTTGRPRRGVLIVDAGERSAFATCRALGRAGYRVGTASSRRPAPAEWSRYSERRFRLPNPRAYPQEFAETVARIVRGARYDTLLACSEGSLWALSSNREIFDDSFMLGLPDQAIVAGCMSKVRLHELAPQARLGIPETVVCADREEAFAAAEGLGFPVVLKPRSTVFDDDGEMKHVPARVAPDGKSLDHQLDAMGWPCLVQRREAGPTVSCGGVAVGGGLLAVVCSRYERTWPAAGGSACFSRSLAPSPALLNSVERLVELFGWEGIFELELMEPEPGRFLAIDFNPRTYGSISLSVKAGVPLPAIWCDWLFDGRRVDLQAPAGYAYRWADGELCIVDERLRRGDYRGAVTILRPHRRVAHAYFCLNDPVPLIVRSLNLAAAFAKGNRTLSD